MKNKLLVILSLILSTVSVAQLSGGSGYNFLDVNDVNLNIYSNGELWGDSLDNPNWDWENGAYEWPKGGGVNALFAGHIWVGGLRSDSVLVMAAQRYRKVGNDFYPGPLDSLGNYDMNWYAQFDRVFKMRQSDIWMARNNGVYNANILNWPGKGNPNNNTPMIDLAPFEDVNNDGIYNPYDGDYPLIKGDEALWTVFNDVADSSYASGGDPVGIEVQLMVYAYVAPGVINSTVYYDYAITKKSPGDLYESSIGLFVDVRLGNPLDEFVACHSSSNIGIGYNGDAYDEDFFEPYYDWEGYGSAPPAIAVKFVQTPLDSNGNELGMSGFKYFVGTSHGPT